MNKKISILLGLSFLFSFCGSESYTPKPKGYFKIELPIKSYVNSNLNCPFSFEIPAYSILSPDSSKDSEPCWLNLDFNPFNATTHFTYKTFKNKAELDKLIEDANRLVYEHTIKASEINESQITKSEDKVYGILYELKGNTANSFQFFVTDSNKHFLRGAFYFNFASNQDSIAPVQKFLIDDMIHLIGTIQWK